MREVITEIRRDPSMNAGMMAMLERKYEFDSTTAATLAGIAMVPEAKAHMNRRLRETWKQNTLNMGDRTAADEVIIGGGLHAAIYAAVRVAKGFPKPLVVEADEMAGGAIACSEREAFYLNSRNRPGRISAPGQGGALNVLPAAPIQPADISASEFQRNTDLGFVIRLTLAMNAVVMTGLRAKELTRSNVSAKMRTTLSNNKSIYSRRIIVATGLGDPVVRHIDQPNVLTFTQFMKRMDEMYPLRGMNRVAVVGAGDSGKTVIEALTGQGPSTGWSVTSLDYVNRIDWYGVPTNSRTRENWETCNRSRYKGIARFLPRATGGGRFRIKCMDNAQEVTQGYEMGFVDDKPYDLVVDCKGYSDPGIPAPWGYGPITVGGRVVGQSAAPYLCFKVGPCAAVPASAFELGKVKENATALFRYAERTAALAASLD